MKVEKWQFTTVPYIDRIKWEHPITQSIYMWMCKFANEYWVCYPSIDKLSECCGCWVTSIKTYIQRLIDLEIILKNNRYKAWLQTSSEYFILHPTGSHHTTTLKPSHDYELYPPIIIENKTDILNLLGEEYVQEYKQHLTCLWYMIELWYKLPANRDSILEDIQWLKDKAEIYWYRMVDWWYNWNLIKQKFDAWSEWHKEKKDKIDWYKNSVLRFLNPNNQLKWKQKK